MVNEAKWGIGRRLQIEDNSGLFAFANQYFLFRKILESSFGHSYAIIFELEIWNPQFAALRGLRLQFSIEKYFRIVLPGDHNECAQILSGFEECAQGRSRCPFNVEFVLITAAGYGQLVRAAGNRGKVHTVLGLVKRRLAIEADLGSGIAGINMQVVGHCTHDHD